MNEKSAFDKKAIAAHKKLGGKIAVSLKDTLDEIEKLSTYYTPGVAAVSSLVAEHKDKKREYTWTNNSVAVISDGSAVLGLGNIGPEGALPVMEGKSMLFKHFANIDAVPIVLDVHTKEEIVAAAAAIAPSFGGINLEDIAAPLCFDVEEELKARLSIPVFHDDQHGTAVVVLAGLINAMKLRASSLTKARVVIVGAGAAGIAIAKLLHKYGTKDIVMVDSKGVIHNERTDLNPHKQLVAAFNTSQCTGQLEDALVNADVFVGVSQPGLLTQEMITTMCDDPVIFAMANPVPEILPDEAKAAGVRIMATGRSDFPNQVNNAVCFPGIFRGALDNNVREITDEHKTKAAEVIAALVDKPTPENIIPSVLDTRTVPAIADVIR